MTDDERDPGLGTGDQGPAPPPQAEQLPEAEAVPPPADASVPEAEPPRAPRPLVERVGMALIAAVLATLFAGVGAAAFVSGEPFLGIMAGIGAAMTAWVGALTLIRG
jgi:hypothetical protein